MYLANYIGYKNLIIFQNYKPGISIPAILFEAFTILIISSSTSLIVNVENLDWKINLKPILMLLGSFL